MKLELKHLAPYLPYQLKFMNIIDEGEEMLSGIDTYIAANWKTPQYKDGTVTVASFYDYSSMWSLEEIKPTLRPLSDILKDEFNFIYENETDYESIKDWVYLDPESRLASKFSYLFFEEIFRYHLDLFGLIPAGLAIDINTLNK